jgi:hypothetical protein
MTAAIDEPDPRPEVGAARLAYIGGQAAADARYAGREVYLPAIEAGP